MYDCEIKNIFDCSSVYEKLSFVEEHVNSVLSSSSGQSIAKTNRDIQVLDVKLHPKKISLNTQSGKARLLHDLASIELQAMELALRTLTEYEDAPKDFRNELAELVISESKHLQLCLNGIQSLGHQWGDWPIHMTLWNTVSSQDTLLERIFIVHRYFEGSGLDAADSLLKKVSSTTETASSVIHKKHTESILKIISTEEIDHVAFGSRWFKKICLDNKTDSEVEFKRIMHNLLPRLPKRLETINKELRLKALFTEAEIAEVARVQTLMK